jgi:integrase
VKLYKKSKSSFYWYDFTIRSQRYRGSTKETNEHRAAKLAALKFNEVIEGTDPLPRKPPSLRELSERFLGWMNETRREDKTKTYYRTGWRLLSQTRFPGVRIDRITAEASESIRIPGSASTANCALRTLRRMLHKAEEWKLIRHAPKIRLVKEYGRSHRLDGEAERKLLEGAAACGWREQGLKLFEDVLILMRETGMRNERELFRLRIEHLDWQNRVLFVPDSKTPEGRRFIPISNRAYNVLKARCGTKTEGWVFATKRSKSGHLTTMGKRFRDAREKAGLPRGLVLYCGRHDYGTRILRKTGNLAAVMKTMGHKDVKTAMQYQHPELDIVRAALDRAESAIEARA